MISNKSKTRMQRPGTEAIRTKIERSKPKREITKIANSQNTKRIYGQPSEQLFPKRMRSRIKKEFPACPFWFTYCSA